MNNLSELRVSENLSLPKESATWVLAYLAKRGAGKTYNAAVQAEEMLKANIPIGVIDGMGIWWGLRVSNDGKGSGLPIVVFGGEHADLPLNPEKATEMAKAIVESNISFVLDLSGFSKNVMRKIVQAFLDELYRINRVVRHVFIEEADMFAPQKPFGPEAIMCFSSVDNFIRRGGNHNLGCTLITQRTAVLNKDVLTQADCLVILRTLAPQDKEAIQAWVKEQTEEDKDKLKVFYDSLNDLENGEAWVWHPEKPAIYCRVKFRQRETFHATREFILNPHAAEIKLMDVGDFISKFQTVFKVEKPQLTVNKGQVVDPKLKEEIIHLQEVIKQKEKAREEAVERANEITKQVETLEDKQEALLSELAQLNSVKKLRDAILEILPIQTAIKAPIENGNGNGTTTLMLTGEELNVQVAHSEKTVQLSTVNQQGQIMYTALNDLPKEGFTEREISDALDEHGWPISHGSLSANLSVNLPRMGLIIRLNGKPAKYRLPSKVKVSVAN
ncbi:MAG: hypothetical protein WC998_03440 [Candidatus Paceibacterota bacterium]|jgi:hypothetical protein